MPSYAEFRIREPIWQGRNGNEAVGLNRDKLADNNTIYILYRDANKELVFPHPYHIKGADVLTCPSKKIKGNTIHIVPLDQCYVLPEFEDYDDERHN